jgi:hypothetical protein
VWQVHKLEENFAVSATLPVMILGWYPWLRHLPILDVNYKILYEFLLLYLFRALDMVSWDVILMRSKHIFVVASKIANANTIQRRDGNRRVANFFAILIKKKNIFFKLFCNLFPDYIESFLLERYNKQKLGEDVSFLRWF